MGDFAKVLLIIAGILILVGALVFVLVMSIYRWDFIKLSTEKYETNTYVINEEFDSISINTTTADITFELASDGVSRVVCYENKDFKHSVKLERGILSIKLDEDKKWHFGINFSTPKITVFLAEREYSSLRIIESTGDVDIPKDFKFNGIHIEASTGDISSLASAEGLIEIKTSTGDITVKDITAGVLELSASTGDITVSNTQVASEVIVGVSTGRTRLSNLKCELLDSSGSTGDMLLSDVIATNIIRIDRSTGDVRFERCDAEELYVKTDTGNVIGSLLSEKVFITKTDTGRVNVPNTITGGRCEISTDTGNIIIDVE